jgi:hypothetical protein
VSVGVVAAAPEIDDFGQVIAGTRVENPLA